MLRLTATGSPVWLRAIRGSGLEYLDAVAVGPDNTTYVAGRFGGTIEIDDMTSYISVGFADALVLAFDGTGDISWSRSLSGMQSERVMDLAVDNDRVFLTGTAESGIDLGGGTLSEAMFIGAIRTSDGAHLWSRDVVVHLMHLPLRLRTVVAASGDVVVSGETWGIVDAGGGIFDGNNSNLLMARFDGITGTHIWSAHQGIWAMGEEPPVQPFAAVVGEDGSLIVAGAAEAGRDFGGGPVSASPGSHPFLARYADNGDYVAAGMWSMLDGTFAAIEPLDADFLVAGTIDSSSRMFFARVPALAGEPVWSWNSPGSGSLNVQAAAIVADICVVGGSFGSALQIAGKTLTETGTSTDGFVAARACAGP